MKFSVWDRVAIVCGALLDAGLSLAERGAALVMESVLRMTFMVGIALCGVGALRAVATVFHTVGYPPATLTLWCCGAAIIAITAYWLWRDRFTPPRWLRTSLGALGVLGTAAFGFLGAGVFLPLLGLARV